MTEGTAYQCKVPIDGKENTVNASILLDARQVGKTCC